MNQTITKEMVTFKKTVKKIHEEKFVPSVIEPSFGVGRLLYAILEHSFYVRPGMQSGDGGDDVGDEKRSVMSFKPVVC